MSKVNAVYDEMITLLVAALPDYVRTPNPYVTDDNNELYLKKSFGVTYGPAVDAKTQIGCQKYGVTRLFSIILTQQVTTTDHNTDQRVTIEQDVMADAKTIIDTFCKNTDINGTASDIGWTDDSGIEFLQTDRQKYYILQSNFSVRYTETVV